MQSEAVGHTQVLSARCSLVLALASASFQRRSLEGTQILQVIERAKCLLLEQSDQAVNIEALAKSLGVGYSRFRRAFREYTGFSPAQYHLQLRINRAAELLRGTTLPVQVIAETLGFESSYYFSRIFSEKLGSSPRAYRARIQSGAAPTTQAR
jgi:transcriptional regulator GlxA family with amidase domain